MRTSQTFEKIASALIRAQKKMGAATKGAANPFFKTKYADLGAVMEVVKEPLNEEGISILQPTFSVEHESKVSHFVETVLLHESGQFIASEPLKLELNKNDMQQLGSCISYARRYTLQSLLSIPTQDDDGEIAMNRPHTTAAAAQAPAPTAASKPTSASSFSLPKVPAKATL